MPASNPLTQWEQDMVSRAVNALEAIADELRSIRELKTQEVKELEKKSNAIHSLYVQKIQESKAKNKQ